MTSKCFQGRWVAGDRVTPIEFERSTYLGDRLCKSFRIDGHKGEVKIGVDVISRVRGEKWDFYSAEDIKDGFIVLEGATSVVFEPPGPLPNDWIECESIAPVDGGSGYRITFSLGAASAGTTQVTEVRVTVVAGALCLEDSTGKRIRT